MSYRLNIVRTDFVARGRIRPRASCVVVGEGADIAVTGFTMTLEGANIRFVGRAPEFLEPVGTLLGAESPEVWEQVYRVLVPMVDRTGDGWKALRDEVRRMRTSWEEQIPRRWYG